jgi:hypothetical protein
MSINGNALNHVTVAGRMANWQRDLMWAFLTGIPVGGSGGGPVGDKPAVIKTKPNRSKEQQILDLIGMARDVDDLESDDYEVEYQEIVPDKYITIIVTFNDFTYRFDAVIPGQEDEMEIEVLNINTIDDIDIEITNLRVEITK